MIDEVVVSEEIVKTIREDYPEDNEKTWIFARLARLARLAWWIWLLAGVAVAASIGVKVAVGVKASRRQRQSLM